MENLTTEQVLAMAPDAASAKAGQGLANPGKWVSLGRNERSVWGECQGSGKTPYRTQADMGAVAFSCSCPSRKFPCKHGLGLLLLFAAKTPRLGNAEAPPWVAEWIVKRDAGAQKKAEKTKEESDPADPETAARREADRAKRAAKREERVRAGLADLQVWLSDLVRQGLAQAKQYSAQHYDGMAARMVDSQAPGVARRLRAWPGIISSSGDWADRALSEAGSLQWLLNGFSNLETLPRELQASVRNAIGFTVTEQDLEGEQPVRDTWQVVGQRVEEEDSIRVQRTWLWGEKSRRAALCLSFAAPRQPLDISLLAGTGIDADLVFYPSAAPLRAAVRTRHGEAGTIGEPAALPDFATALDRSAALLAGDPWLERTPWFVRQCHVLSVKGRWFVRDATGATVPIVSKSSNAWPLFAVSGGAPVAIAGEWDGNALRPLGVFNEGRFVPLGIPLF